MTNRQVKVWVQRFNDRPSLVLQWIDPETGVRKSKSAGTPDPEIAAIKAKDLEYELRHNKYQEPSRMDWSRFRELFEAEYVVRLRPRTREKTATVLDVFEQIVKPTKLANIDERTLGRFVRGMEERKRPGGRVGLADITRKNYMVVIKTALKWAERKRFIHEMPDAPKVSALRNMPEPVSEDAVNRLLSQAPTTEWRAFLLCGWYAGLRLSEALQLRWEKSNAFPWADLDGDEPRVYTFQPRSPRQSATSGFRFTRRFAPRCANCHVTASACFRSRGAERAACWSGAT